MRISCIYCGHGIDLPSDASLRRIACPACGSRFSLVGEGAPPSPQGRTVRDPDLSSDPTGGAATVDHRPSGEPTEVIPGEAGEATGTRVLDPTDRVEDADATTATATGAGGPDSAAGSRTALRPPSGIDTDTEPDDEPGPPADRRMGRFELLDLLGTGAFGSVWKAKDPTLHRFVALKMAHRGAFDPAEADRFFREARSAAQLRHPNIVGVHEVGRDAGRIFIVGDYVDGKTLQQAIDDRPLAFRESAAIASKIARALHHAHDRGVIHRDLKPSNVMVDARGEPIVMDFGLARRESGETSLTLEGRIMGTPNYMSPEQAAGRGHQADRRSDVYSLGVVLFRLCTGELPFRGNFVSLVAQIIAEEPPHPAKLNNLVPRDLATITLKCLRKEPDRRYATAEAAADDLDRWLKGEPILARDVGRVERAYRWCRRKPALAALSAAAVVLALSTFFAILVGYVQTRSRLRDSLLSQARADRQSLDSGRSWAAALALEDAAKIRPGADLREEYLRVLDLPDFRFERTLPELRPATGTAPAFTSVLDSRHALVVDGLGRATVADLDDSRSSEGQPVFGSFAQVIRVSPDGRTLVATRSDRLATEAWDLASRSRLGALKATDGTQIVATRLAFAADSGRIAAIFEGPAQSKFLATFAARNLVADSVVELAPRLSVDSVNFLPDGRTLALTILTDSGVVWKSKQWVELHRPGRPEVARLLVDSNIQSVPTSHEPRRVSVRAGDGWARMAVAGSSGSVKVWDIGPLLDGSGEPREALSFKGSPAGLFTAQFSPDGGTLATFDAEGVLRLHDSETGELLVSGPFARPGEVPTLLARPQWVDGDRIVGESTRELLVFRVRRPLSRPIRLVRRDSESTPPIPVGIVFAPSERWLACSMPLNHAGLVDLGSRDAGSKTLAVDSVDSGIGFGTKSDRVNITAHGGVVATFAVEDGRIVDRRSDRVPLSFTWAAASDDRGHLLLGGNDKVNDMSVGPHFRLWDHDEGRSRFDLDLTRQVPDPGKPGKPLRFDPDAVRPQLRISPDGTVACLKETAASDRDRSLVRIFDLSTGARLDEYFLSKAGRVALSSKAGVVAVGQGPSIRLIRRGRGGGVDILETPESEVVGVALDPAGRRLASVATREGVIRLWDADRGLNFATFHAGRSSQGDVAISPGGRWLGSSDGKGRLRAWDLDEVGRILAEAGLSW